MLVSSMTVRDAIESDMSAVQRVYEHYVRNGLASFEEVPPTVEEMKKRRAGIVQHGLPYLVAETEGRVVGYAYATVYRTRSAYRFTLEDSVYVSHDCLGRGIGRALLTELIARCEAGPWRQMIAVIGNCANEGSIALHRKMGFATVGTLKSVGFKLGQWVDSVLMQRSLGAGDTTFPE